MAHPSIRVVLGLCSCLQDLHITLAPTDAPTEVLTSLLGGSCSRPNIRRLWINFHRRAGFGLAPWSMQGILQVLEHSGFSKLRAFTTSNVLIISHSGITATKPLPPLRVLRLRNVTTFGPLERPIRFLTHSLRSTLTTVDVIDSSITSADQAFGPVAGSLGSFWVNELSDTRISMFTALRTLRIGAASLSAMSSADLPPRLLSVAIDLPDAASSDIETFSRVKDVMRHALTVLPIHPTLRNVALHARVPPRLVKLYWAFAILYASAAEEVCLRVTTEVVLIGGLFYARPESPALPATCAFIFYPTNDHAELLKQHYIPWTVLILSSNLDTCEIVCQALPTVTVCYGASAAALQVGGL